MKTGCPIDIELTVLKRKFHKFYYNIKKNKKKNKNKTKK